MLINLPLLLCAAETMSWTRTLTDAPMMQMDPLRQAVTVTADTFDRSEEEGD